MCFASSLKSMNHAPNLLALAFLASLSLGADAGAKAEAKPDGGAANADATMLAKVGARELTVREFQAKLREIPFFQLEMMGRTEAEAKRHVLRETFIRDSLFVFGAEEKGITKKQPALGQMMRVRANATLRAVRSRLPSAASIPKEELQRYYEENLIRYDAPERLAISRILVATAPEAEAVIAAFKTSSTYSTWEQLAREKSLDKATSLRGGNLGFLAPDGSSNEAGVTAPPELVKAASAVRDGEIVSTPVKEGASFAVIWRRGTRAGVKRTFAEAEAEIRDLVHRAKVERATKELIDGLRKNRVSPIDEAALALAEPPAPDAVLREPKK